MKYLYKRSRSRTLLAVFLSACLLTAVPGRCLTNSEEHKMGEEFLKHARRAYHFVEDPFIVHYFNEIGRRLASFFPEEPFDYHFYVIENPVYNAFAAPAGHVFVNSGLISAMDSEEELAGILTHEIAHVYCRHIAEKIEKNKTISLATLAGMAAAVFLGSPALAVGTAASGQAASLSYSRQDERQADQLGVKYLCRAGYSARGLLTMLEKIQSRNWFSVYDIPSYLSTHPGTEERIAYLDTLLATRNFEACRQNHQPDNTAFALVRTKLTALYDDTDSADKQFQAILEKDDQDAMAHYGYGLALSRKARHTEAVEHFQAALDNHLEHPELYKALADARLAMGDYRPAWDILEKMPATQWYDPEKELMRAKAADGTGRTQKSMAILEALLDKRPDHAGALYALGNIYGKQGDNAEAHYYLGLYHQNRRELETARFHLGKALSLTDDADRKAEIETALEEVREQEKDQPPPGERNKKLTRRVIAEDVFRC